jgi:hypothetical protein
MTWVARTTARRPLQGLVGAAAQFEQAVADAAVHTLGFPRAFAVQACYVASR